MATALLNELIEDDGGVSRFTENALEECGAGILKYDMNGMTGEASRSLLNAIRAIRNKVSISGTVMTITKEDDAAPAWTANLATSASADNITSITPV